MNRYRMFFVQTSTLPPRMHQKLTKHGKFCKQNNQLPTKSHEELNDNSNVFQMLKGQCFMFIPPLEFICVIYPTSHCPTEPWPTTLSSPYTNPPQTHMNVFFIANSTGYHNWPNHPQLHPSSTQPLDTGTHIINTLRNYRPSIWFLKTIC